MTVFWRDGFYRTNAYGNMSWVEGHWVNRDGWGRTATGESYHDYFRGQLMEARVGESHTSRFVNPNADCPVCGDPVFFFQNEYGSRVYFDELGPPWPKHSCTDNTPYETSQERSLHIQPAFRSKPEIAELTKWLGYAAIYPDVAFEAKHGAKPWSLVRLLGRFRGELGVYLVCSAIQGDTEKSSFYTVRNLLDF